MSTQASTTVQSKPSGLNPAQAIVPGLMVILVGAIQGDGALISSAYRPTSPVSEDRLSFPWEGATAVTTSAIWGITQVMLVLGLIAFLRTGAAGGRAGRIGALLAVTGAAIYVPAHTLSLIAYDAQMDDPVAIVVITCFGVGTVVQAIGLLMAGMATLRTGVWSGWRRFTPLALGIWMVAMLPLQFTAALPLAVAVYAFAVMALGWAMIQETLR